ncbi:MAG: hypothetical protein DI539_24560 [Flavobacterium psychrophilum]|nr:MAG: hypothetical protein DI539_24560 [Flavobacterium psychrophilum]
MIYQPSTTGTFATNLSAMLKYSSLPPADIMNREGPASFHCMIYSSFFENARRWVSVFNKN